MKARAGPTQEAAEMLAIQALGFLAEEPERLDGFLAGSGIASDTIRAVAADPAFLAGVLEHMLANESLLIAFAHSAGIDPADVARAGNVLSRTWDRDLP